MKDLGPPHMKKPCANCPFRKDVIDGWLGKKKMTDILEHDNFKCHKKREFQCAGHMLIKGYENAFVRLASRLRIDLELTGRELVFDTIEECINHHDDTHDSSVIKEDQHGSN